MLNLKNILYSANKSFRLRQVEKEDLPFLMMLRNHPETLKFLGTTLTLTKETQEKWFSSLEETEDKAYYIFEKIESVDNENKWFSIGMVRTHDIDNFNKHMGVGGDILQEYRGQGYAKVMYELIFRLAFEELNFNRLWLSVIDYNVRARNLYKKVGFKETGIQRQAVFKDGKYHDYIYMDILKTEYNKN